MKKKKKQEKQPREFVLSTLIDINKFIQFFVSQLWSIGLRWCIVLWFIDFTIAWRVVRILQRSIKNEIHLVYCFSILFVLFSSLFFFFFKRASYPYDWFSFFFLFFFTNTLLIGIRLSISREKFVVSLCENKTGCPLKIIRDPVCLFACVCVSFFFSFKQILASMIKCSLLIIK